MVRQPSSTTNFRSDTATKQKWHLAIIRTSSALTSTGNISVIQKTIVSSVGDGYCRQLGDPETITRHPVASDHLFYICSTSCVHVVGGINSLIASSVVKPAF